jgi:hypothetical protein
LGLDLDALGDDAESKVMGDAHDGLGELPASLVLSMSSMKALSILMRSMAVPLCR